MFEAGDAQFLDQDRLHEPQIRPLVERFDPQLGSLFRAAMAIGARSR